MAPDGMAGAIMEVTAGGITEVMLVATGPVGMVMPTKTQAITLGPPITPITISRPIMVSRQALWFAITRLPT